MEIKRPECFDFTMDFLGDPERKEIEDWVSEIEGRWYSQEMVAELIALEREACAQICERDNDYIGGDFKPSSHEQLASAIRSRH